jgi:hypothetical protein
VYTSWQTAVSKPPEGAPTRDPLALPDADLLADCDQETLRASGPGGQHRNKTESAVRLRHRETGVVAQASERRSQHENRARALERLRAKIALEVRRPVDLQAYAPPPELLNILPSARQQVRGRNPAFWPGARALLDLLAAEGWAVAPAAARLGLSTGQLSRLILGEPDLVRTVNAQRAAHGMAPLR